MRQLENLGLLSKFRNVKYADFIYWAVFLVALVGGVFACLQSVGLKMGGTHVSVQNSSIRLGIMLFYYAICHGIILFALFARTIQKKISRAWLVLIFYVLGHSLLYILIKSGFGDLFTLYIKLIGIIFFVFLHSIKISDKQIEKISGLSLKIFKITLFFSFLQFISMTLGFHTTMHSRRLDAIFSDYNGMSSFLLTIIPLLWHFGKKKSVYLSILIIFLSNSASCIVVLFLFLALVVFNQFKKKRYFLKMLGVLSIMIIGLTMFLMKSSIETVRHPDNPYLKIQQLISVLSYEKIVLIKNNIDKLNYVTAEGIIGIEYSSGVKRLIQFTNAVLGWDTIIELLFGFRQGWAEGFLLKVLINFGLLGFIIFAYVYWKYYIQKTKNKIWRLYFISLLVSGGFALPIFSFPISMFMVSVNIYCFQRLLNKKNETLKSQTQKSIHLK